MFDALQNNYWHWNISLSNYVDVWVYFSFHVFPLPLAVNYVWPHASQDEKHK